MGALRKKWTDAKKLSETAFKNKKTSQDREDVLNLASGGTVEPYPYKFAKDLGPTLDKFESEKDGAKKKTHQQKALGVITQYKQHVLEKKSGLEKQNRDPLVHSLLTKALNEIETELKKLK